MLSLLYFFLQILFIVQSIRQQEKAGVWSWSKCVFVLGFVLLESLLLLAPYYVLPPHSRYFARVLVACCVTAVLNYIWLIVICRRWPLPNSRTSLQAYRDEHPDN